MSRETETGRDWQSALHSHWLFTARAESRVQKVYCPFTTALLLLSQSLCSSTVVRGDQSHDGQANIFKWYKKTKTLKTIPSWKTTGASLLNFFFFNVLKNLLSLEEKILWFKCFCILSWGPVFTTFIFAVVPANGNNHVSENLVFLSVGVNLLYLLFIKTIIVGIRCQLSLPHPKH